jgi:hypothetical protein
MNTARLTTLLDRRREQPTDRRPPGNAVPDSRSATAALAQRLRRRRVHAIVLRNAGQRVDVLGRLVLDDVDDVVDRDDADELVLLSTTGMASRL